MSFLDCPDNFEFSHKGMWKDPNDSNYKDKGQMPDKDACSCACSDTTNCVAYTFQKNKVCWLYHTLSEKIPETSVDAYVKKSNGFKRGGCERIIKINIPSFYLRL